MGVQVARRSAAPAWLSMKFRSAFAAFLMNAPGQLKRQRFLVRPGMAIDATGKPATLKTRVTRRR